MTPPHPEVRGLDLDAETHCAHYKTALDIIAIKMKCCGVYYACKDCHEALAGHPSEVWPQEPARGALWDLRTRANHRGISGEQKQVPPVRSPFQSRLP